MLTKPRRVDKDRMVQETARRVGVGVCVGVWCVCGLPITKTYISNHNRNCPNNTFKSLSNH